MDFDFTADQVMLRNSVREYLSEKAPTTFVRKMSEEPAGFSHRRKMLRRSLVGVVDAACFEEAGVSSSARPEELSLDEWARLTRCASGTPQPS